MSRVTLSFNFGVLGYCEIDTDTEHGSPDAVFVDGVDFTENGPVVDFILLLLGDRFTEALAGDKSVVDDSDAFKSQRDSKLEREGA